MADTFIPYSDPNAASATIADPYEQYQSIAPFSNDVNGITAAYNTPEYQVAAQNAAAGYGGGSTSYTPQQQAGISSLQGQLDNLDPQQQVGMQNIDNSYNLSANRLDQSKGVAQRNYDTSTQQNSQSYANNRRGIISRTGANANALQRLLGINGSGNSSAAYELAPYAAGLQGSQDLGQAQQVYANNGSSLDTGWQDYLRNYGNAFEDLNNQKYQQQNGLKSSISQARANLLSGIDQARGTNYNQDAISSLLDQMTQLGQQYASPVLREQNISYAAPNLSNYTMNKGGAQTQGGAASEVDPTFLSLLAGQRDQYGNLMQG